MEETNPDIREYCVRIAILFEKISDSRRPGEGDIDMKAAAARWWESAGDRERARLLYLELADLKMKISPGMWIFSGQYAIPYLKKGGNEKRAREIALKIFEKYKEDKEKHHEEMRCMTDILKEVGEGEKARELFREYAQKTEQKLSSIEKNGADYYTADYIISIWKDLQGAYKEIGGEEFKKFLQRKMERREKLRQLYLLKAKKSQEWVEEKKRGLSEGKEKYGPRGVREVTLTLSVHNWLKAGEIERAKEVLIEAARITEYYGDKEGAIKCYAKLRDKDNVMRLLSEVLREAEKRGNVIGIVEALRNKNWLTGDTEALKSARYLALSYARTMDTNLKYARPEEVESYLWGAVSGYAQVVGLLRGEPSVLRQLWEDYSIFNPFKTASIQIGGKTGKEIDEFLERWH